MPTTSPNTRRSLCQPMAAPARHFGDKDLMESAGRNFREVFRPRADTGQTRFACHFITFITHMSFYERETTTIEQKTTPSWSEFSTRALEGLHQLTDAALYHRQASQRY